MPHPETIIASADDNRAARYRAVSRAAATSVVVGSLSILMVLSWYLAVIPVLAIYLGWRGLKQIARTPEEYTGENLAWTGIGLAVVFFVVGSGWLLLVRASEVPYGYQRVDYAELQPDANVPGQIVPPAALELNDKKVFIKGYIVPGRQQVRLRKFSLCPTNGVCTFCVPNPKPTEIIVVSLCGDLMTDYSTQLIGIGGKFHVDPEDPHGKPYSMEVDCLR
jgi:hypothetical protein